MAKTAGKRQYGWHFYRGLTRVMYSGRGSAIQLVHGKRYQVQFTERKSGKCSALVHDGFASARVNYPDKAAFEAEWVSRVNPMVQASLVAVREGEAS